MELARFFVNKYLQNLMTIIYPHNYDADRHAAVAES
jgi:hypothetical protein